MNQTAQKIDITYSSANEWLLLALKHLENMETGKPASQKQKRAFVDSIIHAAKTWKSNNR